MNIKSFRDYSEHDVVNLFAFDAASGDKGTFVKIQNGLVFDGSLPYNISNVSSVANSYSPRMSLKATVTKTVSGNKPFGMLLYDVRETTDIGIPASLSSVRQIEQQAVLSGQAVPVLRKGLVMLGDMPAGVASKVGAGSGIKAHDTIAGAVDVALPTAAGVFGIFLGATGTDGYAVASINCY